MLANGELVFFFTSSTKHLKCWYKIFNFTRYLSANSNNFCLELLEKQRDGLVFSRGLNENGVNHVQYVCNLCHRFVASSLATIRRYNSLDNWHQLRTWSSLGTINS